MWRFPPGHVEGVGMIVPMGFEAGQVGGHTWTAVWFIGEMGGSVDWGVVV